MIVFVLVFSPISQATYQLRHCYLASHLCYYPLVSELVGKFLNIWIISIQKVVEVNINHFDAQKHIHNIHYIHSVTVYSINAKKSGHSGFTVLKANENG